MQQTWPNDLFEFAFFPPLDNYWRELAEQAEMEDWKYQNSDNDGEYPILANYLRYTYRRLAQERKISLSDNGNWTCFNTGLVTPNQEPLFATFERNRRTDGREWYFKGWFRRGHVGLNIFSDLPELAHYFDDPSVLVLDIRKPFRINIEHIIEGNLERFPEPYRSMQGFALQNILNGAIDNAKERTRRNYKAAIPNYYNGEVSLLLPLCLTNPQRADLALAVEIHDTFYRAATCLTLEMAYINARLLAKPDRDWLQP